MATSNKPNTITTDFGFDMIVDSKVIDTSNITNATLKPGEIIMANPGSKAIGRHGIIEIDPWTEGATMRDIEVMHIRLDNPGISKEEAEKLFEVQKEMDILDDN